VRDCIVGITEEGFINYAFVTRLGTIMYIPRFTEFGSGIIEGIHIEIQTQR
jgi:hypothetical protein